MADIVEKKALSFLIKLAQVIRNRQMYNEKHPVVMQGMEVVSTELKDILASVPSIMFGQGRDILLIQGNKVTERNIIAEQFLKEMKDRHVSKVIMHRGVPFSELEAFATLMSKKPQDIFVEGHISPELLRPFNKIEISEVELISEDDLEGLTEAARFFNEIFKEEFKDMQGPEALRKIGAVIKKILPQLREKNFENEGEEMWEFFEKSIENFGGGDISKTKESLKNSIRSMEPDVQQMLFGRIVKSEDDVNNLVKRFSGERKASIIAEEVHQGKNISSVLDNLVNESGEIVQLAEEIAKKFGVDDSEGQNKLSQIFNLLQQLDRKDVVKNIVRGKVVIAETDEVFIKEYESFFKQLRFVIQVVDNGKDLLDKVTKDKEKPDLVVMEAKLPEVSGIEILQALDMARIRTPIIMCTELESIQTSFEVQMYPKLTFFAKKDILIDKDFKIEKFLPIVDEYCPAPKIDLPEIELSKPAVKGEKQDKSDAISEEMQAELKKAREIQRNLMPKEFPDAEGLEIYSYYKAYDMIGGDYFDVIPIDDQNIGFLIADVSGHGITGAMVMVMVRSAVHTWARHCTNPKDLLAKVNPMVSRDILPGFFCTVYYGILNLEKRMISCSCAGHNPAILWKNKEKQCIMTKKGGMPLGILSGAAFERTLQQEDIYLEPGDRMIFYTDGLVETMDPDQEEYTEERLFKSIAKVPTDRSDFFTKYIVCGVLRHQNTGPQHDDLTMLTFRMV